MSSASTLPRAELSSVAPSRILVAERQGQLCNQLLAFAHMVAYSEETGCPIHNPSFYKYAHHFERAANTLTGMYPPGDSPRPVARWARQSMFHLGRVVNRILKVAPWFGGWIKRHEAREEMHSLEAAPFPAASTVVVDGWATRHYSASVKHAQAIREFFTPIAEHRVGIEATMNKARAGEPIVVGVHMRWGDFRTWADGVYFRSAETFADVMQRTRELFDRDVRFLIACIEPIPPEPFRDFDCVFGHGGMIEDLYCLAACDYLIGTPRSTYSSWASFYGETPMYFPPAEPEAFDLKDFQPYCLSMDV